VPEAAERAPSSSATSVAFTEEMKGYVAFGESDPVTGDSAGRRDDTALMFHLTIRMDDIDEFVGDRQHTGAATGWVDCPALGGRLPVSEGVFNLFVEEAPAVRRMLYRLFFTDGTGHDLTLVGHKEVRDDPGLDVWPDTSTLFTRVLQGHVRAADDATATVVAAGVLHIHLLDFARQLTTFRVDGPSGVDAAGGLMKFGRLFVGELWDVYGPGHVGNPKSAAP
jgi:cholesterol oxidase